MTEQQDRQIFRRVYNLYQGMKRANDDRAQWEQLTQDALSILDEYSAAPFVVDLIRAVYAEANRLYTPPGAGGHSGKWTGAALGDTSNCAGFFE